jgi:MFS family permease
MVLAVVGVGGMLSQFVGGYLADTWGRRLTLVISVSVAAMTFMGLAYAQHIWQIVALAFMIGMTVDMYRPASQALVADIIPPRSRVHAYGLLVWAVNLGFAVAMVIGGALTDRGFIFLCFSNAAACAFFAAVAWFALPETRPTRLTKSSGFLVVLAKDHILTAFLVAITAYSIVFMQAFSTLPIVMRADGISPGTYGLIMAVNGAIIITLQPFAARYLGGFEPHRVLAIGVSLVGAGYGLAAAAASPQAYVTSVAVWSLGEIVVYAIASAIIADVSPPHFRGRYLGAYGFTWSAGTALAPLIGTTALRYVGASWLWIGCAITCAGVTVAILMLAPAMRMRNNPSDV